MQKIFLEMLFQNSGENKGRKVAKKCIDKFGSEISKFSTEFKQ